MVILIFTIYRKPSLSVPWVTELTTQVRDCSKSLWATRSCPGKLGHFPANTPSWAIIEIIVKFHER
jgi:hypothetical protein